MVTSPTPEAGVKVTLPEPAISLVTAEFGLTDTVTAPVLLTALIPGPAVIEVTAKAGLIWMVPSGLMRMPFPA
jgi:hypothetical protein